MEERPEKIFNEALFDFLTKIDKYKKDMLKQNITKAKVACPKCKQKSLVISLQGTKNHLWASCRNCTFRMVE